MMNQNFHSIIQQDFILINIYLQNLDISHDYQFHCFQSLSLKFRCKTYFCEIHFVTLNIYHFLSVTRRATSPAITSSRSLMIIRSRWWSWWTWWSWRRTWWSWWWRRWSWWIVSEPWLFSAPRITWTCCLLISFRRSGSTGD